MKQTQIRKVIYDGAVQRMGVCLEGFINDRLRNMGCSVENDVPKNIDTFVREYRNEEKKRITNDKGEKISKLMKKIWKKRNKTAHPQKKKKDSAPLFNYDMFEKVRDDCVALDKMLKAESAEIGMEEIRLMSADEQLYTMGNAGDFIKHGSLILFLDWWHSGPNRIRFADPFGGNPWTDTHRKIKGRLEKAKMLADEMKIPLVDESRLDTYLGSGHTALNNGADVWASDRDLHRKSDLAMSGLKLLETEFNGYDHTNGYCILEKKFAENFDLILIDPLGDFLKDRHGEFGRIGKLVREELPELFVMVFVLDMWSEDMPKEGRTWDIHNRYMQKREALKDIACSIRCPKITGTKGESDTKRIRGEKRYESEILIIGQEMGDDSTSKLRANLKEFAELATKVLPLKTDEKVEFWDGKNE